MGNKRELDALTVRDLFNSKKNGIFLYKGKGKTEQKHCRRPRRVKLYNEEEIFLFKMRKHGRILEGR